MEMIGTRTTIAAFALAAAALAAPAAAQNEQFIPANFYWVGPYAPGGSGFGGGMIDYFAMLNERDRGINGVKLTWEKCETEHRQDQVHRHEGRRDGQAAGQEDRQHLPRLGLRQGNHPGA